MKLPLSILILLTDLIIPFLLINIFGDFQEKYTKTFLFTISLIFSISIVLYTAILNKYDNYFFSHMDEKLEIAFSSTIFAILIQFFYFEYFGISNQTSITLNLLYSWIIIPIILLSSKYFIKQIFFMNEHNKIEILILGNDYKFTSYETNRLIAQNFLLRELNTTQEVINENEVNYLVINKQDFSVDDKIKIENKHKYVNILTIPIFLEKYLRKLYISDSNINMLLQVKPYSWNQYFIKRSVDYLICLLVLPLFFIFILLFTPIIKIQSFGKVLFKQSRVTIDNKKFEMYKFRTMHNKNDYQMDNKKIFPFGKFLRKYKLDEIPQIFNVILGDMHISGPRAEWHKLNKAYLRDIPYYQLRYTVKSGITGWAQVMFRYGYDLIDAKQKLMYDLYYIKNWTFWLELEIGLRTLLVVLRKQGI